MRYSWPAGMQNQANIAGGRLDEQIRHRVGLSDWSITSARDAALAEVLATTRDIFNVMSYGADDTGIADSTVAIQSALTAAEAVGGVAYVPAGTFKITAMLTINANGVTLQGAGIDATIIELTPPALTTDPALRIGNTANSSDIAGLAVRDLQFLGKGGNTASGIECLGGATNSINDLLLENVAVVTFRTHGMDIHDLVNQTSILGCRLTQNGTDTTENNIRTRTNVNGVVISGCRFREAGDADNKVTPVYSDAIDFEGIGYEISGNVFEKHARAIRCSGVLTTRGAAITGNHMEFNTSGGIRLSASALVAGFLIAGNWIDMTEGDNGVLLDTVDGVVIKGNQFHDGGGHTASEGAVRLQGTVTNSEIGPNFIFTDGTAPPHVSVANASTHSAIKYCDQTFTALANDATPTVAGLTLVKTGGTTTITDLDDGVIGQEIEILSEHAITITDGTNILLNGSANFVMAAGDVLVLRMFNSQVWVETSRQVN